MARRRRRRNSSSIASVIPDVVSIASRLSWWGALLTGVIAYFVIAIGLSSFIESLITGQEGNMYAPILEARLGYIVRACHWVGMACLIAGVFFAIRNFFVSDRAGRRENWLVTLFSKILGRGLD